MTPSFPMEKKTERGHPSKLHNEVLNKKIKELEAQGYRIIKLQGKSPDAIALKHNKVYAVEILGYKERRQGSRTTSKTLTQKRDSYAMFDGVIFEFFKWPFSRKFHQKR